MRQDPPGFPVAEALRILRLRQGLTQVAASKLDRAPDFRTLSHWETRRKLPSMRLLHDYLGALGLDFCDLQAALDRVTGVSKADDRKFRRVDQRLVEVERRLTDLERGAAAGSAPQERAAE